MTDFNKDYSEESRIVFHENKWQIEKRKIWLAYNPVQARWFNERVETVYEGLENWFPNGLHKKIKSKILIRREAIDNYSLKPISAFFVQEIKVEADCHNPNEFVSECKGMFFVHYLEHNMCFPLALRQEEPRISFGKEKRVTEAEARHLIKQGVTVMSEHGKSGLVKELNVS